MPLIEEQGEVINDIPRVTCPMNEDDYLSLSQEHDPLAHSEAFGIDIYLSTVNFISRKLECNNGFTNV